MTGRKDNKMEYRELLEKCLNNYNKGVESDFAKFVAYVYHKGDHVGVKRICDRASSLVERQQGRAKACRYYKMASSVVGDNDLYKGKFLYDPNYDDGYEEAFGEDEITFSVTE